MDPKDKDAKVTYSFDGIDNWVPASDGSMTENMRIDEDMDSGITYSFGDLGQLNLFSEEDMREKYPALKQAYEHYQSVLEVCKTKEKEENEN